MYQTSTTENRLVHFQLSLRGFAYAGGVIRQLTFDFLERNQYKNSVKQVMELKQWEYFEKRKIPLKNAHNVEWWTQDIDVLSFSTKTNITFNNFTLTNYNNVHLV